MKRSQINDAIRWAEALLTQSGIKLPAFGYWDVDTWKKNRARVQQHLKLMLGWDVTDFGSENFNQTGAVLFTLRNGSLEDASLGSPYAEKLIILKEGQFLPNHYHAQKTEDIINRSGGVMQMHFYNKKEDGSADLNGDVSVLIDGVIERAGAGEAVCLNPGSGARITPYLYHIFGAKEGEGPLVVGEVSSINDDLSDNYFAESTKRFSAIQEDQAIYRPLCNEYPAILYEGEL